MNNEKIEVLGSIYEYIGKLIDGIEKMANKFYEGYDKEGCEILSFASEGLEWVIKALEIFKNEINTENQQKALVENFTEINNGLENEDYILVADIFNYEITPLLKAIRKNIDDNLRK